MVADLLPGWVGWLGPLVVFGLSAATLALVPGLALYLVRRRLVPGLHWTKRAELATEARTALILGSVLVPVMSVTWVRFFNGEFSRIPDWALTGAVLALIMLAAMTIAWWFISGPLAQPLPGLGTYYWLTLRKLWPLPGLLLLGFLAPRRLLSPWMALWTLAAVAALYGLRYLAEAYVHLGVAGPADDRVNAAVARAAGRMNSAPPRTFVLESHAANALALPARNVVILTTRLIAELDDTELEAVALHEIAHLNEHPAVTRRRSLGMVTLLPILAIKPLAAAGILVALTALVAAVALRIVLNRIDAGEESRADHEAVEMSHQSAALGTALLKMHRAALIPAFIRRDPHGPLYDRLERAGVRPDFEPIESGPKMRRTGAVLVAAVLLTFGAVIFPWLANDMWDGEGGSDVAIAFGWRTDAVLWRKGFLASEDGDYVNAAIYMEESAARGDYNSLAYLPWVLAAAGRCDEVPAARDALAAADPDVRDLVAADAWVLRCNDV